MLNMTDRTEDSVTHNGCLVVNEKTHPVFKIDSQFYDDIVVGVGYNADSGDVLVMNHVGNVSCYRLGNEIPVSLKLFSEAPGEKSLFFVACNQGSFNANDFCNRLGADLAKDGVNVISLNPEQLGIRSGYQAYYNVHFDVATKSCVVERQGGDKHEVFPFEGVAGKIERDSIVDKVKFITNFYMLGEKEYSPKYYINETHDRDGLKSQVEYLGYVAKSSSAMLADLPEKLGELLDFITPKNEERTSELMFSRNALSSPNFFYKAFDNILKGLVPMVTALAELEEHKLGDLFKTQKLLIRGDVTTALKAMHEVADKLQMTERVDHLQGELDRVRNIGPKLINFKE